MELTKRELREIKRIIKRRGNQHVRRQVKQTLATHPDEVDETEFDYGGYRSVLLNGMDCDATRRRRP